MATHGRARRGWPVWLALAVGVLVVGAAVYFTWPASTTAAPANMADTTAPTAPTPVSAEPTIDERATAVTDGTVQVGDLGVRPGLWQSDGGPTCQWSRDKGVSWTFDTGGRATQPIVISLRKATWFVTKGCGTWKWIKP